jgi:hypothetical protein
MIDAAAEAVTAVANAPAYGELGLLSVLTWAVTSLFGHLKKKWDDDRTVSLAGVKAAERIGDGLIAIVDRIGRDRYARELDPRERDTGPIAVDRVR